MSLNPDWSLIKDIARQVIKHFEGCHLTSYVLKGESWATLGWGEAIPLTQHPKTITQAEADQRFEATLQRKENQLRSEIPPSVLAKMSALQIAGVLSFRYNVKDDVWLNAHCNTRKALVIGNLRQFVYWHAKWINGQAGPLPGLKRRRRVERELLNNTPLEKIRAENWYQGDY